MNPEWNKNNVIGDDTNYLKNVIETTRLFSFDRMRIA